MQLEGEPTSNDCPISEKTWFRNNPSDYEECEDIPEQSNNIGHELPSLVFSFPTAFVFFLSMVDVRGREGRCVRKKGKLFVAQQINLRKVTNNPGRLTLPE